MGQNNTKPREERTRESRRTSRRHEKPEELVIQPQGTFDSHFTLISPMSALSNPSMFMPKRHEQNEAANLPPGSQLHNSNNIIIRNVPPLPDDLRKKVENDNAQRRAAAKEQADRPLLKKKKGRKSKSKKQVRRVKEAFSGCAIVSADHADKMRVATTKTVTATSKTVGACAKKTGKMIEDSGVVEKSGLAALNCAKATKKVAAAGAKELADAMKKGCVQSHIINAQEKKNDRMSEAARNSLDVVNQSDHAILMPVSNLFHPPAQFEPLWRESRGMLSSDFDPSNPADAPQGLRSAEITTPLALLDRAFASAAGLHQEDSYFERLSAGSVAPSPFVDQLPDISAIPRAEESQGSQLNISLFSETTSAKLDSSDLDFARVVCQPPSRSIADFDVTENQGDTLSRGTKKNANKSVAKRVENGSANHPIAQSTKNKVDSKPAAKNTKGASSRSIFRQMEAIKAQRGIREAKSFGSLKLTESAPGVMQAKDYRNIALSTSEGGISAASAPIRSQYYTLCSPSASSTTSSNGEYSRGPLLTTQTLSNAAFLFSPSYAGGDQQLLQREQVARDPAFSISTFASRARLSKVSQPAITIPVSKSWEANSAAIAEEKDYDLSGAHSLDKSNSKHVRFSEANEYRTSQKGAIQPRSKNIESVLSVQTTKLPQEIEPPEIETKLSDLTEATMLDRRVSFDGVSPATTTSSFTQLSERRISFSEVLADDLSPTNHNGMSPSDSQFDGRSSASSKEQGSIHWAYREENGKVTMTPKLGKKHTTAKQALPTTSPMIRFRSAQSRFSNPAEKVVPVKRTPPKKFVNRTPKKNLVSTRINGLNDRLKSTKQPVAKNSRRDTSGHRVLAPHKASLVNPIFRNVAPTTEVHEEQREIRATTKEVTPFDEREADVAPSIAASHDSSDVSDMFAKLILGNNGVAGHDISMSIADTECTEDPFADIVQSNYETEPEIPGMSTQLLSRGLAGNSIYSFASHSSGMIQRYSLGSTVVTDKDNTVSLTNLHNSSVKGKVNPADVYHRQDTSVQLCLSPTQRTPMQARKWRTLAAAAQEKDSFKKGNTKKGQRKALSERSVNVQY